MPRIGRGNKRSTVPDADILAALTEGYTVPEISYRLGVWAQRVRDLDKASQWKESPLNRKTSARFKRCKERGGCVPSNRYVRRSFATGDIELSLCQQCGVPIWSRELHAQARSREVAKARGKAMWRAA